MLCPPEQKSIHLIYRYVFPNLYSIISNNTDFYNTLIFTNKTIYENMFVLLLCEYLDVSLNSPLHFQSLYTKKKSV